jgi:diphthine-ammonia ligase
MKLGVLFSGGKDSTLALHIISEKEEIACLITLVSKNKESYMFHTPNIEITTLQAQALDLPLIKKMTEGKQEEELNDLKEAIVDAKERYDIEGIITGAVESVYQLKRIQNICDELVISCINPLWKKDQKELMDELVLKNFKVIISGIFAYPLTESWLGKKINSNLIDKLVHLSKEYGISIAGEGGEIETTVLDAPLFKQRIDILDYTVQAKGNSGVFIINKARLVFK